VTHWNSLGPDIVVDGHVDRKVCVADLFAEKIRPFSVGIVLRYKVIVLGDNFVLVIVGCFTKIGNPLGLLAISMLTEQTFKFLRTLHSM
jgi:hypothetical protein